MVQPMYWCMGHNGLAPYSADAVFKEFLLLFVKVKDLRALHNY